MSSFVSGPQLTDSMLVASQMLLQFAVQDIGQLTDIEPLRAKAGAGGSGGRYPARFFVPTITRTAVRRWENG
jgi:hypothetical protein